MENPDGLTYEASGLTTNCDNQALTDGYYIALEFPDGLLQYQYETDPAFTIYEWACSGSSSIGLQVLDLWIK